MPNREWIDRATQREVIENDLAACSTIRGAVAILAKRSRTPEDLNELTRILHAQQAIRARAEARLRELQKG